MLVDGFFKVQTKEITTQHKSRGSFLSTYICYCTVSICVLKRSGKVFSDLGKTWVRRRNTWKRWEKMMDEVQLLQFLGHFKVQAWDYEKKREGSWIVSVSQSIHKEKNKAIIQCLWGQKIAKQRCEPLCETITRQMHEAQMCFQDWSIWAISAHMDS